MSNSLCQYTLSYHLDVVLKTTLHHLFTLGLVHPGINANFNHIYIQLAVATFHNCDDCEWHLICFLWFNQGYFFLRVTPSNYFELQYHSVCLKIFSFFVLFKCVNVILPFFIPRKKQMLPTIYIYTF